MSGDRSIFCCGDRSQLWRPAISKICVRKAQNRLRQSTCGSVDHLQLTGMVAVASTAEFSLRTAPRARGQHRTSISSPSPCSKSNRRAMLRGAILATNARLGLISRDPAEDDHNLYRYVKNNPINREDPSGLVGVGHHWVTMSKLQKFADQFEKDALFVLIGAYSGVLEKAHNRRRMGGVSHTEYDEAIERALSDFLENRRSKKRVSVEEAKQLAQDIYSGKAFDTADAEKIRAFNRQVVQELRQRKGFLEPGETPTDQLIKQGKSYAKTERGLKILRAAKFASLFGVAFTVQQTASMASVAAMPLSEAFRHIENGDYTAAESVLIGESAGSLLSQMRAKEPRLIVGEEVFKGKIREIVGQVKEWDRRNSYE